MASHEAGERIRVDGHEMFILGGDNETRLGVDREGQILLDLGIGSESVVVLGRINDTKIPTEEKDHDDFDWDNWSYEIRTEIYNLI